MPVIIDGTLGVNAAAVTTTSWNPTNLSIPGNSTIGDATSDTFVFNAGSLNFNQTGQRITGDFSNSTPVNRVSIQTSTVNGNTNLALLPNGTSVITSFNAESDPLAANGSIAQLTMYGTETRLSSSIRGTGTYLPMTFYTGGSERLRILTDGKVGINTSSPETSLHVNGNATFGTTGSTGTVIRFGTDGANGAIIRADRSDGSGVRYLAFGIDYNERMRVTSAGELAINAQSSQRGAKLFIKGANASQTSTMANFIISTTDTQAADIGGSIGLGGLVGGDDTPFGYISGRKENSTSGNYAGYLAFATQTSGAAVVERMRIDSLGNVGIGTSSSLGTNGKVSIYETTIGRIFLTDSTLGASYGGQLRGWGVTGSGGHVSLGVVDANTYNEGIRITSQANSIQFYTTTYTNGTTTERMRIDSNGGILVGGNTSYAYTGTAGINFSNGTSDTPGVQFLFKNNKNWGIDSWNSAGTNADESLQYLRFVKDINESGGTSIINFSRAGAIGIGGTLPGSVGVGIAFPSSQVASSDPNTLDDYEEGTWTPVWASSGTTPTVSYSVQDGRYIKIGRVVHFWARIYMASWGSNGSGYVRMGGLPFTANQVGSDLTTSSICHIIYTRNAASNMSWPSGATQLIGRVAAGSNYIEYITMGSTAALGDGSGQMSWTSAPEIYNNFVSGTYLTTA